MGMSIMGEYKIKGTKVNPNKGGDNMSRNEIPDDEDIDLMIESYRGTIKYNQKKIDQLESKNDSLKKMIHKLRPDEQI